MNSTDISKLDWCSWYNKSIDAITNLFGNEKDAYSVIWNLLLSDVLTSIQGRHKVLVARDIYSELMLKLKGDDSDADEFFKNCCNERLFDGYIDTYRLSSCFDITRGIWADLLSRQEDPISSVEATIPFIVWHTPFVVSYVRDNLRRQGSSDMFVDRLEYEYESDEVKDAAELLSANLNKSLDEIILLDDTCNNIDQESMLLDFLKRGVPFEIAGKLVSRICHAMELRKEDVDLLNSYGFDEALVTCYSSREYHYPRTAIVRKFLKTVNLMEV